MHGTDQTGKIYSTNVSMRGANAFSSSHPGGVNFCLADGSVRFVSETLDGHFNNQGVQTDPNGDRTRALREVVDTTWERLIAKADGKQIVEQPINEQASQGGWVTVDLDLSPWAGQDVKVEVFRTGKLEKGHYIARSVTIGDRTIELRDKNLRPTWAGTSRK